MSVQHAVLALFLAVAVAQDQPCLDTGGTCQTNTLSCSGHYVTGKCSGPANRQCCVWSTASDQECLSQGGKCQADSVSCSGSYTPGLCAGPANRQCCRPTPGSGGSCSAQQQNMACELFRSSNVRTARVHVSGIQDNAFPYNNLRDMCEGRQASRSSYDCGNNCRAPGGTVCLSVSLLRYLVALKDRGSLYINELAGACHSCGSKHYTGNAVDLRKEGRATEYITTCRQMGGVGIDEGTHVHCQF